MCTCAVRAIVATTLASSWQPPFPSRAARSCGGEVGCQKRSAGMAMKRSAFNELLIAQVKLRPALWKSKCKHYRNVVKKNTEWKDIANILGVSDRDVQARWRNLRDTYARKHREELKQKAEVTSGDEPKEQRWIHYAQLSFLSEEQEARTSIAESQGEYIVPTTSGHEVSSASSLSTTTPSIVLSDVRSLAVPATTEIPNVQTVQIKKEITDHVEEEDSFLQAPSSSPLTVTTTNAVLAPIPALTVSATPLYRSILPTMTLKVAENPMQNPISPPPPDRPEHQAEVQTATVPTLPSSSEQSAQSSPFVTGRKRTATSWSVSSLSERKARLEMDVLVIQKKKMKVELRKYEADERKAVTETLLIAEEMKKLKAEAEFFVQEKSRSEEDARMAEMIAEFHAEERRKTAAAAEFYREEKRKSAAMAEYYAEEKRRAAAKADWFLEQQKTETLRQRLLLLEIKKMKKDLGAVK